MQTGIAALRPVDLCQFTLAEDLGQGVCMPMQGDWKQEQMD